MGSRTLVAEKSTSWSSQSQVNSRTPSVSGKCAKRNLNPKICHGWSWITVTKMCIPSLQRAVPQGSVEVFLRFQRPFPSHVQLPFLSQGVGPFQTRRTSAAKGPEWPKNLEGTKPEPDLWSTWPATVWLAGVGSRVLVCAGHIWKPIGHGLYVKTRDPWDCLVLEIWKCVFHQFHLWFPWLPIWFSRAIPVIPAPWCSQRLNHGILQNGLHLATCSKKYPPIMAAENPPLIDVFPHWSSQKRRETLMIGKPPNNQSSTSLLHGFFQLQNVFPKKNVTSPARAW